VTHYQQLNNSNDLDVLILVAVTLCSAHQDHLCSRSGMSALNADPFKEMRSNVSFILGLTTACTVFSSAAYTVKLLKTLVSFCSDIVVIPAPTVPPSERCSESETLEKCPDELSAGLVSEKLSIQWAVRYRCRNNCQDLQHAMAPYCV
jgi:hypothetical protein